MTNWPEIIDKLMVLILEMETLDDEAKKPAMVRCVIDLILRPAVEEMARLRNQVSLTTPTIVLLEELLAESIGDPL